MTKILLAVAIIISLASCKNDTYLDIDMSDESLVALIQDMHIANAVIRKYKKENRDSIGQVLRKEMSNIHDISEERIDFVMEQLQRSPKKYLELEKLAVAGLKELKDSLKTTPVLKTDASKAMEKKR